MRYLLPLALPVAGLLILAKVVKGESLSKYDEDIPPTFTGDIEGEPLQIVNSFLRENFELPAKGRKGGEPIAAKRKRFDEIGAQRKFDTEFSPAVIPTKWGELTGEWVLAKNSDPDRRILYLHGGAFSVGSCLSHRAITAKLAKLSGACVLAINYRLMPEHSRKDGIEDCRTAYNWILENGPDGAFTAKTLAVGGDSAGGNLALMLLQWARDNDKRPANAAFAFSPITDGTFSGRSIKTNLESDKMLKPLLGDMFKIPYPLLLLGLWKQGGFVPSAPAVSPVFGKLHDLPPTLLQASTTEILYDDAVRYTNKARKAGSEVILQTWSHMPHVWQLFDEILPEANQAMKLLADFLQNNGV